MITNKLLLSCLLGIGCLGSVVAGSFYLFTTSKKNKAVTHESKRSESSRTNENGSANRVEETSERQADSALPKV